jgi:hypothetical protein
MPTSLVPGPYRIEAHAALGQLNRRGEAIGISAFGSRDSPARPPAKEAVGS